MRRFTTHLTSHQDANLAKTSAMTDWRFWRLSAVLVPAGLRILLAMALGAFLLALVYQIPVTHQVDIGGYDSAYVQGFYEPERNVSPTTSAYLAGSDGTARWTHDVSYLVFPQAGLPAQVTLHLRGWRAKGNLPEVVVLLNDTRELGRFRATNTWEDHTFVIDSGLLKPNDVVLAIHSETAVLSTDDPRPVGVLLDHVTYRTTSVPTIPYPAQLVYGALAAGMLYLLLVTSKSTVQRPVVDIKQEFFTVTSRPLTRWFLSLVVLSIAFFLLYRNQPPYPHPLRRQLIVVDGVLAMLLALRYGSALTRHLPLLLDVTGITGLMAWTAAILVVAQNHVTLSTPGVENDFRVFALRSAHLFGQFQANGVYNADIDGVIRADGFYNLGYPFLLWLVRPLTQDNPFLAARLIAALSGMLLLGTTWWLARRLLGRGLALIALMIVAFSPLVVQYALYVGTDLPFAALCAMALALLIAARGSKVKDRHIGNEQGIYTGAWQIILAGVVAGFAFLVRHPGLLLLPFGWTVLLCAKSRDVQPRHARIHLILLFTVAFGIAILPQLIVNAADTGQPFYSQQAKNIWFAVFANSDWTHWNEASNNISLSEVVFRDPERFLTNWGGNIRAYFGTGGEDTSEFGRAIQLRLLGFPANWLALGGLMAWLGLSLFRRNHIGNSKSNDERGGVLASFDWTIPAIFLGWIGLYVLAVSFAFVLPRFFLPLVPIYAIAAVWAIAWLGARATSQELRTARREPRATHDAPRFGYYALRNVPLLVGIVLIPLLWGGFSIGAQYVLEHQSDAQIAAVRLVQATLHPGERLIVRTSPEDNLGKYSAIAHLVVPAPRSDDLIVLRGTGAQYLLRSSSFDSVPINAALVKRVGPYTLYRITP